MDIVVASPGRLMQHKEQGNVFLSKVNTIVIDEVDTMLTQGFGSDIRGILRATMAHKKETAGTNGNAIIVFYTMILHILSYSSLLFIETSMSSDGLQLIMASATLTKAVRSLLSDVKGGGFTIEYADPTNKTPKKLTGEEPRMEMKIIEVDGVHR